MGDIEKIAAGIDTTWDAARREEAHAALAALAARLEAAETALREARREISHLRQNLPARNLAAGRREHG